MFHWICPECGCEIPPTVKECPTCDPQAAPVPEATQAAPAAVAAVAEPVPVVAAPPAPEAPTPTPVAAASEPEPEPELPLDPLLAMAEQVRAAQVVQTAPAAPVVEPPPVEQPSAVPAPPTLETKPEPGPLAEEAPPVSATPVAESAGLAELASAVGVNETLAPAEAAPQAHSETESRSEQVPSTTGATTEAAPVEQPASLQPASSSVALLAPPAEPAVAPLLLAAPAPETFAPEPVALTPPAVVTEPATVPPAGEKAAAEVPPSGSWLALAPLQNYTRAASNAMQPAAPDGKIVASDAGPRMTLPGPALPPQLVSFKDANIATAQGDPARRKIGSGIPGWLVSFLVMLVLLVAGVSVVFYFLPMSRSNADTKDTPAETQAPAPASQSGAHPLAQTIEVTGFRIVIDLNKKSEIHYLVVNHSGAAISDMTVYVTLRSANSKPGQPPLSRFSFRAPELGPFEAKEMISTIEKPNHSLTLPDWSDLRADVQVGQQ